MGRMILICKSNEGLKDELTVGRIYSVLEETDKDFCVLNDLGEKHLFTKDPSDSFHGNESYKDWFWESERMKMYYEFSEHEYYALITVSIDEGDYLTQPHIKAAQVYAHYVAGENEKEVLMEADPVLRTEEYAFKVFAEAPENEDKLVGSIIREFNKSENTVLLIDTELL